MQISNPLQDAFKEAHAVPGAAVLCLTNTLKCCFTIFFSLFLASALRRFGFLRKSVCIWRLDTWYFIGDLNAWEKHKAKRAQSAQYRKRTKSMTLWKMLKDEVSTHYWTDCCTHDCWLLVGKGKPICTPILACYRFEYDMCDISSGGSSDFLSQCRRNSIFKRKARLSMSDSKSLCWSFSDWQGLQ